MAEVWLTEPVPSGSSGGWAALDAVRAVTGWGAADADRAMHGAPTALRVQVDAAEAGRHVLALRALGLAAEVREDAGSFALDPAGDLARLAAVDAGLGPLFDELLGAERRLRQRFSVDDDEARAVAVSLVRAYRRGPAPRREALHEALAVCPKVRWYVDGQLGRAARELREGGGPEWVAWGLWATAAADGGLDWRDAILGVEALLEAARHRGVDPEPDLRASLGFGSEQLTGLVAARWLPGDVEP
ncbi:MAG: hypothetical protein U0Q07_10580 [Acidimicrobiales bacterium]